MSQLSDLIDLMKAAPEEVVRQQVIDGQKALKGSMWGPTLGPQSEAYYCKADELLFGGEAGPGKTDLLIGLALTRHERSLLMRRQYTDMTALIDRALEINGTRDGFNGSPPPKLRAVNSRSIDFGAAAKLGDEQHWKGQPHDMLGLDEAVDFLEQQVRFLMGWVRSVDINQRCRVVLATNPPVTADGQWIIPMYGPWLDGNHPNPAKPGELRYFITVKAGDEVKDLEVPDATPVQRDGTTFIPISRTFIPGTLADNPYLIRTDYQKRLDNLPEPYRTAYREGNFMAGRKDAANQVIPTLWVTEANARWREGPPAGIPMTAMAVDATGGGQDPLKIAMRYDCWFARNITVEGEDIPFDAIGKSSAAAVISHRRDLSPVIVDMGGGYGGPVLEHLTDNSVECIRYIGSSTDTRARTKDRHLGFKNTRTQAIWQFREALDPDQEGGSLIALPPNPRLLADLTTPMFEIRNSEIVVETKEAVVKRLGRSTDDGDAVVMCWYGGDKRLLPGQRRSRNNKVQVITKRTLRGERRRRR
jgi:hypothetical protein